MHNWLLLAILATVLWGITGVTQKLSTNNISFELSMVWFSAAFLPISALIAGSVRQIPMGWRLIDCSFGVFGVLPLCYALRLTKELNTGE